MKFSQSECNLLREIGKKVEENKDYSKEEISNMESELVSFIMNKSSKNGDIDKCVKKFDSLLYTFSRA